MPPGAPGEAAALEVRQNLRRPRVKKTEKFAFFLRLTRSWALFSGFGRFPPGVRRFWAVRWPSTENVGRKNKAPTGIEMGVDPARLMLEGLIRLGVWLSLVERCVRDAEVASSNLVAPTFT